ncbi:hypothetical protein D3C72_1461420 [compost metagenome]
MPGRCLGGPEQHAGGADDGDGGCTIGPRGSDPQRAAQYDADEGTQGAAQGDAVITVQHVAVRLAGEVHGHTPAPVRAGGVQLLFQQPAVVMRSIEFGLTCAKRCAQQVRPCCVCRTNRMCAQLGQ